MEYRYDFLVIGGGIAGLSFALKVSKHGRVALLTKTSLEEANTFYAQGGIATVMRQTDDFEKHIQDTLIAGDFLCDRAAVEKVVHEAPEQIKTLIEWGVNFDRDAEGHFDLHREGGHSEFRILHHKDSTGSEIQATLVQRVLQNPMIDVYNDYFAIDLITQHHLGQVVTRHTPDITCFGAYVLNQSTHAIDTFLAKITLIATGGIGNVYQITTNPTIATGDGIAMVHRARGVIADMEFVQFHPTALYHPGERPSFLITEAMRGYGAQLRNKNGERFMQKYDERMELAPRDVVARAIDNEMKTHGDDFVYLDVTHKDAEETKKHFPMIYEKCLSVGIDITRSMIPVAPAAHYLCGGIQVDLNARTSIDRLYAAGESSRTGLHGANRLASNSLIEAIVFADAAAKDAVQRIKSISFIAVPAWNDEGTALPEEMVLITQSVKEVQQIMSTYVGIVRSNLRLERAKARLEILYRETENLFDRSVVSKEICELRNLISVGYLIIKHAMQRKENIGLHFNIDQSASASKEFHST